VIGLAKVPSLAESVQLAAGYGQFPLLHTSWAVAGAMTEAGVAVKVMQGGTFEVGHPKFGGCIRKSTSMVRNRLPSRPSMSPAGFGLPGGAAPEKAAGLLRTKAFAVAMAFIAQP
jgi:hypothetical protein